jgi:hypothetical protein
VLCGIFHVARDDFIGRSRNSKNTGRSHTAGSAFGHKPSAEGCQTLGYRSADGDCIPRVLRPRNKRTESRRGRTVWCAAE